MIDKSISHTAPKFKVNSLLVVGIQPIRKRERAWWPRGRNSTTGTILSLFNSHIPKFQVWVKVIHSYLNTFILLYFNWSNLHMSINHIIWSIYIICFNMGCLIDYMDHKIWTLCEKKHFRSLIFINLGLGDWGDTETILRDLTVLPFFCLCHGKIFKLLTRPQW